MKKHCILLLKSGYSYNYAYIYCNYHIFSGLIPITKEFQIITTLNTLT